MSVATISFNFQNARGTLAEIPTLLDGQFYWAEDSQQLFIGTAASGNLAITGSTGVFPISIGNVAHKWLNSYDDTTGLFTQSQPGFTDLSGSISTGQIPSSTITVAQITATGTPSSSTFLNGAGQWATPSGGGSVNGSTVSNQLNNSSGSPAAIRTSRAKSVVRMSRICRRSPVSQSSVAQARSWRFPATTPCPK